MLYGFTRLREVCVHSMQENNAFITVTVILSVICGALLSVFQLSHVFPEGLYRYAAIVFISGTILVWGLMAFRPVVAICVLFVLLPFGARLSEYWSFEIGGIIVTCDVVAIWVSSFIAMLLYGLKRDVLFLYFGVFIVLAIVSSMVNYNDLALTIIVCGMITPFLLYGSVVSLVRAPKDVIRVVNALGLVIIICSFFSFLQPFLSGDVADYFYVRLPSVFYNPVIFANVIVLLWPFTLVYEPFGPSRFPTLTVMLRVGGALVALAALLLTGSRGEMLVYLFQIVWLRNRLFADRDSKARYSKYASYAVISAILIVAVSNANFLLDTVLRRFYHLDFMEYGNSAHERLQGASGGLELGLGSPFFGVGIGNFKYAYPNTIAASAGMISLDSAHNFILNLFAEIGLPGLLLWLGILSRLFGRLKSVQEWLYSRNESSLYSVLKCSLFGYTATQFLFYGEFLHKNVGLPMILYFIVIGLSSALYFMRKSNRGVYV